jgi:hypothetical protein
MQSLVALGMAEHVATESRAIYALPPIGLIIVWPSVAIAASPRDPIRPSAQSTNWVILWTDHAEF